MLVTLGRLDGNLGGDKGFGRRGGTRSFEGDLGHIWRGTTGEVDSSMVAAGHLGDKLLVVVCGLWIGSSGLGGGSCVCFQMAV